MKATLREKNTGVWSIERRIPQVDGSSANTSDTNLAYLVTIIRPVCCDLYRKYRWSHSCKSQFNIKFSYCKWLVHTFELMNIKSMDKIDTFKAISLKLLIIWFIEWPPNVLQLTITCHVWMDFLWKFYAIDKGESKKMSWLWQTARPLSV